MGKILTRVWGGQGTWERSGEVEKQGEVVVITALGDVELSRSCRETPISLHTGAIRT